MSDLEFVDFDPTDDVITDYVRDPGKTFVVDESEPPARYKRGTFYHNSLICLACGSIVDPGFTTQHTDLHTAQHEMYEWIENRDYNYGDDD